MIITIKNPIDDSDVEVEVRVSTSLTTEPDGSQNLSLIASGFVALKEPTEVPTEEHVH